MAALDAAGVISSINASEVTPIDLCRFKIFSESYWQLKGGRKEIGGFNSVSPECFGQ